MPCQVVDEVVDEGERVSVEYRPFIQVSIVLNGAEFPILLSDEEKTIGIRRIEPSDSFQPKVFGKELFLFFFLFRGQGVDAAVNRGWCVGFQVNGMVPFPWSGESFRVFFGEDATKLVILFGYELFPSLLLFACSLFCKLLGDSGFL
jgi:hypothetical protein